MTGSAEHHRTIVVLDIADFTHPVRGVTHQVAARDGLHAIVIAAFAETGVDLDTCLVELRGDGVLILVPSTTPKNTFVSLLPDALLRALHRHNAVHSVPASIRLRVALHAGEVRLDVSGAVGPALNLAFRFLEAGSTRAALRRNMTPLAVVVSESFYENVVQQDPAAAPHEYHRIRVRAKGTSTRAWLRIHYSHDRVSRIALSGDLCRQLALDVLLAVARFFLIIRVLRRKK